MLPKEQLEDEKGFNDWLDSIEFMKASGKPVPIILTDDDSDDSEGDRG